MRYQIQRNIQLTFFLFVRCCDAVPTSEDDVQRPKHVAIFM